MDTFAHVDIQMKHHFITCPKRRGISTELFGIRSSGYKRWGIVLMKLVMGCISKQREVGVIGCFEDSILLPKWNSWHDLHTLGFPFLFHSQDCRKE